MAKHTTGEWGENGQGLVYAAPIDETDTAVLVADCSDAYGNYDTPERQANARLIAVAPRLLAFAKLYKSGRGTLKMLDEMCNKIITEAERE